MIDLDDVRDRFHRDGFVAVTQPLFDDDALAEARSLVTALLDRAGSLPGAVRDLAQGSPVGGRIIEVDRAIEAEPLLAETDVFRSCRDFAGRLLGCEVELHYEHLIVKEAHNLAATAWHQDAAYGYPERSEPIAAHLWVPMHAVPADGGCMTFVPGSHRNAVAHRRRGGRGSPVLEAVDVPETSVTCALPAGGLTAHQPRTLHATGPNDTDRPRLAWVLQFRPVGSWQPASRLARVRHRASRVIGR